MFYIIKSTHMVSSNHPEFKLLAPLIAATAQSLLQISQGINTIIENTLIQKNNIFYELYNVNTPSDYPLSFYADVFLSFLNSIVATDNYAITYDGAALKLIPNPSPTLLNQLSSYANKQILIFNLYSSGPNSRVYTYMYNAKNMNIILRVLEDMPLIFYDLNEIELDMLNTKIGSNFEYIFTGLDITKNQQIRLYIQGNDNDYLINYKAFLQLIKLCTTVPDRISSHTRFIITIDNDSATLEYDNLHPILQNLNTTLLDQ